MTKHWEYTDVFLSAASLKENDEELSVHDLAARLSNAIVEAVYQHKADSWELVKMDFDSGNVTIRFRRLVRATSDA